MKPMVLEIISKRAKMESIPMEVVTMVFSLDATLPMVLETILKLEKTRSILVRQCSNLYRVCLNTANDLFYSGHYNARAQGRYCRLIVIGIIIFTFSVENLFDSHRQCYSKWGQYCQWC